MVGKDLRLGPIWFSNPPGPASWTDETKYVSDIPSINRQKSSPLPCFCICWGGAVCCAKRPLLIQDAYNKQELKFNYRTKMEFKSE